MVDLFVFLDALDQRILIITILLIFILQSPILTFPGYVIFIYAGIQWGTFTGALINYVGILLSAIAGYYLGLWTSSPNSSKNTKSAKFEQWFVSHGIKAVILLRILPLLPFNVVSIGSGYARMNFSKYFIYTAVFVIPWILLWTYVGSTYITQGISKINLDVNIYHGIATIAFLSLLIIIKLSTVFKK